MSDEQKESCTLASSELKSERSSVVLKSEANQFESSGVSSLLILTSYLILTNLKHYDSGNRN